MLTKNVRIILNITNLRFVAIELQTNTRLLTVVANSAQPVKLNFAMWTYHILIAS